MPIKKNYFWNTPLTYKGKTYPANVEELVDENGNLVTKNVFADANGGRHFINDDGTLTDVYMNSGELPEVTVTAPMGKTGMRNKMADAYRLNVFNAKGPLGYLQFENTLQNNLLQRQAIMKAAGYNVPQNGYWNDEQEEIWNKLTTRDKEYEFSYQGLKEGLFDKLTGNGQYYSDPTQSDEVKTYDKSNVDKSRSGRENNSVSRAVWGTYAPLFTDIYLTKGAGALLRNPTGTLNAASNAVRRGIFNFTHSPVTSIGSLVGGTVGGYAGGKATDRITEALTGNDWSTFAQEQGMPSLVADLSNPGSLVFGGLGSKWATDTERRALEVAMRTSGGAANPIPYVSNGWKKVPWNRKEAVANYVLTGYKPKFYGKGYYTSLSPDVHKYYQGTNATIGGEAIIDANDVVDAFLYKKDIDPRFGLHRIYGADAGMHTSYVSKNYPNKDIPVYEQDANPVLWAPVTSNKRGIQWDNPVGTDRGDVFSNPKLLGRGVDVGGYLMRRGVLNRKPVYQAQDIWKFNPEDYSKKWLRDHSNPSFTDKLKNAFMRMALRETDVLGTPILTRTPVIQ